ncbi:MAG: HAMP domain-containing sensor histidine kinase [Ferruginibacter sp.]
MKLLYKYSRINLVASVIIFLLASVAFYFLLHFIFIKQLDDDLHVELNEVATYISRNNALPEIIPSEDEITSYQFSSVYSQKQYLRTLEMGDGDEKENYRQLQFCVSVNGKNYNVFISKSLENTDHIIRSVILVSAITILLLLIAYFIINRIVLRRLWKPFYSTMALMKKYRIGHGGLPEFEQTDTNEFTELNATLVTTMKDAESEYRNLKEVTENASHEMQTPVAVIRSKMDVLIQDENLSENQSKIVQEAYTAIQRLTRLNQALLLLSKIENKQFAATETVALDKILEEKLVSFKEILNNKQLNIAAEIKPVNVQMNAALADILFNNLLGNCIRHSNAGGEIKVILADKAIEFVNGPAEKMLEPKKIFTRFYKGGSNTDQHGLGLAIVKEICLVSGFSIEYKFQNKMHSFIVVL